MSTPPLSAPPAPTPAPAPDTKSTDMPPPPKKVSVAMLADLTCPWCYVASKQLDIAIKNVPQLHIERTHKPYLLTPELAEDAPPVPKAAWLRSKFGDGKYDAMRTALAAAAAPLGIQFSEDTLMCSTKRAHRLLLFARERASPAVQTTLLNQLYSAQHTKGLDISAAPVLAQLALYNKLFRTEDAAREWIEDGGEDMEAEMGKMLGCCARMGVKGVPLVVVDCKYCVSGGQDAEVYQKIFEKVANGEEP